MQAPSCWQCSASKERVFACTVKNFPSGPARVDVKSWLAQIQPGAELFPTGSKGDRDGIDPVKKSQ
ncbi:MAG: hypothetical protein CSA33_04715 [Desulfobulbus propionicus]|nr:MAG: hypothetical protein CSA33_04715 [Desulfobulbus propionicus]